MRRTLRSDGIACSDYGQETCPGQQIVFSATGNVVDADDRVLALGGCSHRAVVHLCNLGDDQQAQSRLIGHRWSALLQTRPNRIGKFAPVVGYLEPAPGPGDRYRVAAMLDCVAEEVFEQSQQLVRIGFNLGARRRANVVSSSLTVLQARELSALRSQASRSTVALPRAIVSTSSMIRPARSTAFWAFSIRSVSPVSRASSRLLAATVNGLRIS